MLVVHGDAYQGVVFDLDGTLLTSEHKLPQGARELCAALEERGIWVTLASARPPRSVAALAEELGLRRDYVALNGALAIDHQHQIVAEQAIAPTVARAILMTCGEQRGVEVNVYSGWRWWAAALSEGVAKESAIVGFKPELVKPLERCADSPIHKILLIATGRMLADLAAAFAPRSALQVSRSKEHYLEITASASSKRQAVRMIAARAGFALDDLIVFGDGDNDVPLLEAAGLGIAVDNGSEAARRAAGRVIGSNDCGAVIGFLRDVMAGHFSAAL